MISKPFLDLFLDTRDTSCLILSTIYYFLIFFYSREIIREIIVSYCARLFSDRKAKDDSQDEKDEKWRSKRISRRGELANLFIQPRANVIMASYLKRRNPNDSWIAFYPIVDRNFHVRLPESLKERERGSARGKVGVVLLPRFELVRMRITAKLVVSQKRNEEKRVHG